jgi:hypothetical protein
MKEVKIMNKDIFIKGVEKLVNPVDVGSLHFIQYFNNYIPKNIQKKMVESSGKKTPYMGFVVEPYSYFLSYKIKDLKWAESLLPDNYKLIKTKIFEEDAPEYYGIFGCFNAHTSGFWGFRVELYIIAEDQNTGLLSWIIIDYDTNTITYDPKNILSDPNAEGSIMTIDYDGVIHLEMTNENNRKLKFQSDISKGQMKALDERLWVEGNLSINYGKDKVDKKTDPFALIFDPKEFEKALNIELDDIEITENQWFPGLFETEPSKLLCFPYAQHFMSDSPGHYTHINNKKELEDHVNQVDFDDLIVFSTNPIKKSMLIGGGIGAVMNLLLLIALIY